MPCPNKKPLKAYLTPEEYRAVKAKARQARLSVSAYAKAVCLGHEVKSALDQEAILELLRLKADMGRLGGLLKLGLSENSLDRHRANRLLSDLEAARKIILDKVTAL
jgi:hypothetical protein